MKFSLFAHIERYDDSKSHRQLLEELTELVVMAEEGGFDKFWIGEHHAMDFTCSPNAFVSLAYLAAQTSRIRLGTGTIIAPFYHPIRLAGEIGQLDLMSNGRLEVGIARGAYMFEYERLFPGLDAMEAGLRMRELIPATQQLLIGDYAHDGKYWQFPTTSAVPRTIQQPYPPMWVAARDPNTHEFAVAHGCNVQVTPLANGFEEAVSLMGKFNDACAANPGVARPEVMILEHGYVSRSESELQEAAENIEIFYRYFGKWFQNSAPISKGLIEELTESDFQGNPQYSPENLRANLPIGTPEQLVERFKKYQDLGYSEFSWWMDGHMTFEQKRKGLELFIKEILPAFNTPN
ncbi:MAG: LLM class flavin-dependent oxidoreductase [Actinobacteria bacterium]|uniref:Unannotated protein n=1 Tax=freshwater metagenome TaxID=449393 RepID=A0A6J5YTD3_9ZZZZ|nr:LLM class flavin-dependent oxidoreductase [Actinomycetota bacterium]